MTAKTQKRLAGTLVLTVAAIFAAVAPLSGQVRGQKARGPVGGSASPSGPGRVHPFEPSEELVYVAEFSRTLLKKVDVADFRFTATRQPSTQKVSNMGVDQDQGVVGYSLKFTGDVSSKGFFSKLFNLRFHEHIESIVEPASFTVQTTRKIDQQGKRARISETIYQNGKAFWTEHDPNNPGATAREASATFAGRVQDVLSAIYYLRTQPLEMGKTLELTVSDSGRVYQVPVRIVEKRRMKTALGRVEVVRVDPEVFGTGRMIPSEGQFSIWFTNDSRRIPVSARIKHRFGTFDITLRKVIQHPALKESLAATTSDN